MVTGSFSSEAELDALIEQTTDEAFDDSEEIAGLFNALETRLELPINTHRDGQPIIIERVELDEGDTIVAICRAGSEEKRLPLLDVPLPDPPPRGSEWIHAYRRWLSRKGTS